MRYVTLIFVLMLAPAALAQPCDPTQSTDACPDTTTWQRYFPLDVGTIWQYREAFSGEPVTHLELDDYRAKRKWADRPTPLSSDATRPTTAGRLRRSRPPPLRRCERHDRAARRRRGDVVERTAVRARVPRSMSWIGQRVYLHRAGCGGRLLRSRRREPTDAVLAVPPDAVSGDTQKQFEWPFMREWEMFAGLGVTKFFYELQGEPTRLVYANVGGEQVGTPAFASCNPADFESDIPCPDTTDWRRYFPSKLATYGSIATKGSVMESHADSGARS